MDLTPLFRPRSVAVVGASRKGGRGSQVIENLRRAGYTGWVGAVNPNAEEIAGVRCYPTPADLPIAPELAVLSVPHTGTESALAACLRRGARAAVAFASGCDAQTRTSLAELSARYDAPVVGPNCVGFLNHVDGIPIYSGQVTHWPHRGCVGAAMQSGAMTITLERLERHLGFTHLISLGDSAVFGFEEALEFLVNDPPTRVVVGFLEAMRSPGRLVATAKRAHAANKPVILLRVGRTAAAREASLTHTGALAGNWIAEDAFLRRLGFVLVEDVDQLVETAFLFGRLDVPPVCRNVGLLSVSGGELGLDIDLAAQLGCGFGSLAPDTVRRLESVLPAWAGKGNPLDLTGRASDDPETARQIIGAFAADPGLDLVAINCDTLGRWNVLGQNLARFAAEARRATGKPFVFFSNIAGSEDVEIDTILTAAGIPFLRGARETLGAFVTLRSVADARNGTPPLWPEPRETPAGGRRTLDELDGKRLLAAAGIATPTSRLATDPDDAARLAEDLGFPVVVKVVSQDIAHKAVVGGVAVGLNDPVAVRAAASAIRLHLGSLPLLVERQVLGPAIEVLVGARRYPRLGGTITIGFGGTWGESYDRASTEVLPIDSDTVRNLLRRVFGRAPDALVDVALRMARLLAERPELLEIEANPVLLCSDGSAVAVDALAVVGDQTSDPPGPIS